MAPPVEDAPKNPGGRPSLYKPEYCERVIELGEKGFSQCEIAVALGHPRTTMRSWADQHEDFAKALAYAKECEQAWWENVGRASLGADRFQAQVWKKSMESRFKDDYTDRKELGGLGGGAIVINITSDDDAL